MPSYPLSLPAILLLLCLVILPPAFVAIGFANFNRLPAWARVGLAIFAALLVLFWIAVLARVR